MSLLLPAGLAALLLAPIIIAMHLWQVRYRRHDLSSTLLWSRVLSESPVRRPRRLPLRLLLLALQLAALACGALALARPAWVAAGQHRHLIVAVDTSLAMSATDGPRHESRLQAAVDAVRATIDGMASGDTMTLVDAGTTPRVVGVSDQRATLLRLVQDIHQGYGASSLDQDGALLAGLTASNGMQARTDLFVPIGTASGVVRSLQAMIAPLHVHAVGASRADRAVDGLTVTCDAGHCEAFARLVNTAPRPVAVQVSVAVDDGRGAPRQGSRSVTLPAASAAPIGLALPAGARTVQLRLDGRDVLPVDDVAWAVVPSPVRRTILLVTSDPSSALAQALHAIPNVHLKVAANDGSYTDALTRGVDLTVLDNTGADVQPPGNLLLVNPTSGDGLFTITGSTTAPGVSAVDSADPLMSGVDLNSLVVASATRAAVPAWAHVEVDAAGAPLLFSGAVGGRRVAVLTFDPRAGAGSNPSNFSSLLAFPAFLQNAVQALAPAPALAVPAGAPVPIDVTRQAAPALQPQLGRAVALASSGDTAVVPALRPGLYTYNAGAGGAGRVAANVTAPDSPVAAPAPAAAPAAPPAPVVLAPGIITPFEGWAGFALLGLVVLSAEWWYYVRRT